MTSKIRQIAIIFVIYGAALQLYGLQAVEGARDPIMLENVTYSLADTETRGVKKYVMEADFKAPKERVCGVICDYYNHHTFMPKEVTSKVIGGKENELLLEFVLDLPWPFEDLESTLLVDFNKEEATASWKLVKGNIRRNDGTIEIHEKGDMSHVKQTTYLDIGPYYPDWFVKVYTRTLTYRIMRSIRDRIEQDKVPLPPQ